MKKYIVLFGGILAFMSCGTKSKQQVTFSDVSFTYNNGWGKTYSIFIDSSGNAIKAEGWHTDKKYFKAKIEDDLLLRLDSAIFNLANAKLDSFYTVDVTDQPSFQLDFIRKGKRYKYHVYGNQHPNELHLVAIILNKEIEKVITIPIDTIITFRSTENFYPKRDSIINEK